MKGHLRQELNFWESNETTCRETVTGNGKGERGQKGQVEVRHRDRDTKREPKGSE